LFLFLFDFDFKTKIKNKHLFQGAPYRLSKGRWYQARSLAVLLRLFIPDTTNNNSSNETKKLKIKVKEKLMQQRKN
jgi:hypothetical protein